MNEQNLTEVTEDSSPKARAARLKRMRLMLGVTSEGLAKLLGYTRQTVSYWENANDQGGLSEKGALKITELAKSKGIFCEPDWLLRGYGNITMALPGMPEEVKKTTQKGVQTPDWIKGAVDALQSNLQFFKEIESFLLSDNTAVIAQILDTSMEPVYKKGDWVGGRLTTIDQSLIGEICIVEINRTAQVRVIQAGETAAVFDIASLKKTDESQTDFILKNVTLTQAAPVTRLWRK